MDSLSKIFSFYKMSVYLDFVFLSNNLFTPKSKIEFVLKKYFLIFLHLFNIKKFEISKSHVKVLNTDFYYDSSFGLAGLQGILSRHSRELNILRNENIEVVFDIGANVGCFTILSHYLFNPKNIYSFEPINNVFKCLVENTKNFKEVKINNLAVSDVSGYSFMTFDEANSSISKFTSYDKALKVKTITVKDYVAQNNIKRIDLLKIDVESYENLVLEGCGDFLKNVRYLFIEVTIKENKNYTISSLFSKLYGKGYDFQLLSYRNASDMSFGEIPWMDCLLINTQYKN